MIKEQSVSRLDAHSILSYSVKHQSLLLNLVSQADFSSESDEEERPAEAVAASRGAHGFEEGTAGLW